MVATVRGIQWQLSEGFMVATVREGIRGGNCQGRNSWWQLSGKEFMVATVREGIHGGNCQRRDSWWQLSEGFMVARGIHAGNLREGIHGGSLREGIHGDNCQRGIHGGNCQRDSWWQLSEKKIMVAIVREENHGGNCQRRGPREECD